MNLNQKYRPKTFKDIVGQQCTEIIEKEVKTNTIKPAYLFVGKTGSGKSTTSRVFAKSINAHTIELDAASNNSAERVRELLDYAKQRPIANDYTVVIIDEPQNYSKVAWDSMLLTIENPPSFLIFILCTTEVDKVPQTIYNRCEVFEFTSIPVETIVQRLTFICKNEKFEYNENALNIIAKMADGSMRQAITYLEQCSLLPITVKTVRKILLADSYDNYLNLVYAILDKEYDTVANIVKNVTNIDKYVPSLFSFVLDITIYTKTKDDTLIDTPSVFTSSFNEFTAKEIASINKLRDILLDLQFEGRDNPILKQLLTATLYKFMEESK